MLSVAVQHHPARADLAAALLARVPGAELVSDPDPDASPSPWRTYRRALELTPHGATHRLILQDDVIVCDGFLPAARAAVAARPDRLVAFFVGGNARLATIGVRGAAARGVPWYEITGLRWCPAVALCWPAALIAPMLAFADGQRPTRADDDLIGRFLLDRGERALATVPSLVDHPDDVPSLLGRRRARHGVDNGRVAGCWIGTCDPASIDWR